MLAHVFRTYQDLANEGHFESIKCFEPGHGDLAVYFDEETGNAKLFCVVCNYAVKPGIELYNEVVKRIEDFENEQ